MPEASPVRTAFQPDVSPDSLTASVSMSVPASQLGHVATTSATGAGREPWSSILSSDHRLLLTTLTAATIATFSQALLAPGWPLGWLGVPALLASLRLSPRRMLLVSAHAAVMTALLVVARPGPPRMHDIVGVGVVAVLCAFAVSNSDARGRRDLRLRQLSEVAEAAQDAILHAVAPVLGAWAMGSAYRSAHGEARIGGDVLEVVRTSTGVRGLIGDVRGNGLQAVELSTAVRLAFRESCDVLDAPLAEVVRRADQAVCARGGEEDFVTAVFFDLDDNGWVHVINCGHLPPMRLTSRGSASPLSPRVASAPLGLDPCATSDTYCFEPGDRLLMYTDGLIEARDAAGEFFEVLRHTTLLTSGQPQQAVDQLLGELDRHTDSTTSDDVAVLLAALTGASVDPSSPLQQEHRRGRGAGRRVVMESQRR